LAGKTQQNQCRLFPLARLPFHFGHIVFPPKAKERPAKRPVQFI
jgi:hypothetical protein